MLRLLGVLSAFAISIANAQLVFETTFQEAEVHPLEMEKAMTFSFKVGEKPVTIRGLEVSCSCLAAELSDDGKLEWQPGEEGSIRLNYDLSNQGGKVKKSVVVQLADGTKQTLIGAITIPEYIDVSPKTHRWKLKSEATEKTYKICFQEDFQAKITKVIPTKEDFDFRLVVVEEAKEYHLIVNPQQTETPSFCLFKLYTDSEIPRFQKIMLFSVVDERGPLQK